MKPLPHALIQGALVFSYVLTSPAQGSTGAAHDGNPEIRNYIRSISTPLRPDVRRDSARVSRSRAMENGRLFDVIATKYSIASSPEAIVAFSPNPDLWPGALVQGATVESGSPALISLPRRPAVISIMPASGTAAIRVDQPSNFSVQDAHQRLLAAAKISPVADLAYQMAEQYTLEQAMLDLGMSAKWLTGSARATLSSSRRHNTRSMLVKFVQRYYTLDFSPPTYPELVFSPTVTLSDVSDPAVMGPGNPPVYISSVAYGRMLIYRVTSTSSFDSIRMAIDMAHGRSPLSIRAETRGDLQSILNNSEIQLIILGGGAVPAVNVITGRDLNGFLNAGAMISPASPGYPIAYTVKYLSNNRLAALSYTTEFSVEKRIPVSRTATVRFDNLRIRGDCDGADSGRGEFYWRFFVNNQPVDSRRRANARTAGSRTTIGLSETEQLPLIMDPSSNFTVSGWLRERDNVRRTDDFVGDFVQNHRYENNLWNPGRRLIELGSGSCSAVLQYSVNVSPLPSLTGDNGRL